MLAAFTIAGPLPAALFCSLTSRTGIRIDNRGSAEVIGNHVTEIRSRSEALRGCQNGVGILVSRGARAQVSWNDVVDHT